VTVYVSLLCFARFLELCCAVISGIYGKRRKARTSSSVGSDVGWSGASYKAPASTEQVSLSELNAGCSQPGAVWNRLSVSQSVVNRSLVRETRRADWPTFAVYSRAFRFAIRISIYPSILFKSGNVAHTHTYTQIQRITRKFSTADKPARYLCIYL